VSRCLAALDALRDKGEVGNADWVYFIDAVWVSPSTQSLEEAAKRWGNITD
jgi:hypothetical protein